jgi:hypothetical protein
MECMRFGTRQAAPIEVRCCALTLTHTLTHLVRVAWTRCACKRLTA